MNQAIMEAGIRLYIEPKRVPIYKFLQSRKFPVNYTTQKIGSLPANVEYLHKDPFVRIGNIKVPLLYPQSVIHRCHQLWNDRRMIDFLFLGKMEWKRQEILEQWKADNPAAQNANVLIEDSHNGRNLKLGAWDGRYYTLLGKSKFALCPDGAFRWTYRFFEAILCGAIPVVQRHTDCYDGFQFHYMHDKQFEWTEEKVNHNRKLAIQRLTIDVETIRKEINR
jgi:hypothetical protein